MKFSSRERIIVFVVIVSLIFYFYWSMVLNPVLSDIAKRRDDINSLRTQLNNLLALSKNQEDLARREVMELQAKEKELISPKEEQLDRIMDFIDYEFRWFGIDLTSLRQYDEEDKILITLTFSSNTKQLLGFLRSFSELKTMLVIDSAEIIQDGDQLTTHLRLLSEYR
ncbi:MAG: type II secretion system protein M [Candidatus Margulisbacteria bacterium]|nr:type II secretion system protein M [Candidatus Margulisiibacteriota bacterium]MBU1022271.1 type II secretion system protein M [Candidatus Margulisiibacteriota bacterium]MBU1729290.1 type II secretion system protein M [Candidatus Margulisiibacteriota bacterium]MBU1955563.1 type II secretion system protein M [Candidatus Margulisiibacteriota bacterium]